MALAASIVIAFADESGDTSTTRIRIPDSVGIADMVAFAQDMTQLVANMITGIITGVSICIDADISGSTIKAVAQAFADIGQKAIFQFRSAVSGFFKRLNIPAFDDQKTLAGTDSVDQADNDIVNFVTAMESGIIADGATVQPVDSRGNDVDALKFARESFRNLR